MSTRLQKKLAKAIIRDAKAKRPKSGGQVLKSVGYSIATSTGHVKKIMESEGLREELTNLGFSEDEAKKVVSEILHSKKAKDHDRLDAADKVFKVHGSYAPDKHLNVNVEVEANPAIKKLTEELNALYGGTSEPSDGRKPSVVGNQASHKE